MEGEEKRCIARLIMSNFSNDRIKKTKSSKSNKEIRIKKRIKYKNWIETHKLWSKFIMNDKIFFGNNNPILYMIHSKDIFLSAS